MTLCGAQINAPGGCLPEIIAYDTDRASAYHRHHRKNLRTRISTARERQLVGRALATLSHDRYRTRPRVRNGSVLAGDRRARVVDRRRGQQRRNAARGDRARRAERASQRRVRIGIRVAVRDRTFDAWCACGSCTTWHIATIDWPRWPRFGASREAAQWSRCGPTGAARGGGGCANKGQRLRRAASAGAFASNAPPSSVISPTRVLPGQQASISHRVCRCGAFMPPPPPAAQPNDTSISAIASRTVDAAATGPPASRRGLRRCRAPGCLEGRGELGGPERRPAVGRGGHPLTNSALLPPIQIGGTGAGLGFTLWPRALNPAPSYEQNSSVVHTPFRTSRASLEQPVAFVEVDAEGAVLAAQISRGYGQREPTARGKASIVATVLATRNGLRYGSTTSLRDEADPVSDRAAKRRARRTGRVRRGRRIRATALARSRVVGEPHAVEPGGLGHASESHHGVLGHQFGGVRMGDQRIGHRELHGPGAFHTHAEARIVFECR